MNNFGDNFCKAVNTIAKRIVDKAKYNTTIRGIILYKKNPVEEEYYIQSDNSNFWATNINGYQQYKKGDSVEILIINNDISKQKFILGTVK